MLTMYVVYKHPKDYPHQFVVRRFDIVGGETRVWKEPYALTETLSHARDAVPEGLFCLPRFDKDEPQIVEVWM